MLLDEYDVVVLGGGLKESLLATLLTTVGGKRVLLADRNPRLGGSTPTLNLQQLCEVAGTFHLDISGFGRPNDWRFDMAPKLFLRCGVLSDMLERSELAQYVHSNGAGNMVFWNGGLHEVPQTDIQVKQSTLITQESEKQGYKQLLKTAVKLSKEKQQPGYRKIIKKIKTKVNLISPKDPNDPSTLTMSELFAHHNLQQTPSSAAQYLLGRCIALNSDDSYLSLQALDTLERVRTYCSSCQDQNSPLLYPQGGPRGLLGGCHIMVSSRGGEVLLEQDIGGVGLDPRGRVDGVVFDDRTVKCGVVVGAPEILPERCRREGEVVRAVCVLKREECCVTTATQVIVPGTSDQGEVYVVVLTEEQGVCPAGWCIAVVSTSVKASDDTNGSVLIDHNIDTSDTDHERDLEMVLKPGLDILGTISLKFLSVTDHWVPEQTPEDNVFMTSTLDSTPNSVSLANEICELYEKIMAAPVDPSSPRVETKETKQSKPVKRASSFSLRPVKSVKRSSSFNVRQLRRSGSSASSTTKSPRNSLLRD